MFSVAPFEDERAVRGLASLDTHERRSALHVVEDGAITSAGDALLAIATHFRTTRRWALTARRSSFARYVAGFGYRSIAARRDLLSHFVPDVPPSIR